MRTSELHLRNPDPTTFGHPNKNVELRDLRKRALDFEEALTKQAIRACRGAGESDIATVSPNGNEQKSSDDRRDVSPEDEQIIGRPNAEWHIVTFSSNSSTSRRASPAPNAQLTQQELAPAQLRELDSLIKEIRIDRGARANIPKAIEACAGSCRKYLVFTATINYNC